MAENVSEDGTRYKLLNDVLRQWVRRDKNSAVAAALSSSLPPDIKRKFAMMVIPK
jgi:hypothetical protein